MSLIFLMSLPLGRTKFRLHHKTVTRFNEFRKSHKYLKNLWLFFHSIWMRWKQFISSTRFTYTDNDNNNIFLTNLTLFELHRTLTIQNDLNSMRRLFFWWARIECWRYRMNIFEFNQLYCYLHTQQNGIRNIAC